MQVVFVVLHKTELLQNLLTSLKKGRSKWWNDS